MQLISHDGMYNLALAGQAFVAILHSRGIANVREQLQSLLVTMHECQLKDFDPELQCQIDVIKEIDKAIINSQVLKTDR